MHPILFSIGDITIHSYGLMIMLGAFVSYWFLSRVSYRELGIEYEQIQLFSALVIVTAIVGGKLLFYVTDSSFDPEKLTSIFTDLRQGFVYYGSLSLALPTAIYLFKRFKWPLTPMLDNLAIVTVTVHAFGRIGCFLAGCCYGKTTDSIFGVTFHHPQSQAFPLNTPLHPTQLYEFTLLLVMLAVLLFFKSKKKFDGQLILMYLAMYAVGRSVIEVFRGDIIRGYVFDNLLSTSQFISILVILIVVYFYYQLSRSNNEDHANIRK